MKQFAILCLVLSGCGTTCPEQDPMHDFERCMDALGNLSLPVTFPAGEFCNQWEER